MPDFRGKVALVTGVGRAGQIGQAVAAGFGRAGAKLGVADVNAAALAERARELADEGCDVRAVAGDLTGPEAARRAVATAREQFGGLDVVVNVAGGLLNYGSALDLKPDQLDRELAVNVKTTFYVSQAAIPTLLERGGGAIVNFASVAVLKPQSQMASYIAAKSAVAGLTRALAREFRDGGVRVNAVAPGTMKTADNVAQIKDAKVRWVELDDLVNSAAMMVQQRVEDVTPESWDATFDLNLRAYFFVAQGAIPHLRASRGRIVNMADEAAFEPWPQYVPHCVSKAGVVMLTKGLARALAPEITVNAVAPGAVLLPEAWDAATREHFAQTTPLKRLGSPEDVVRAVRYLLEGGDYVTGTTLVVDGGRLIR